MICASYSKFRKKDFKYLWIFTYAESFHGALFSLTSLIAPGHCEKKYQQSANLPLCSMRERKSYRFRTSKQLQHFVYEQLFKQVRSYLDCGQGNSWGSMCCWWGNRSPGELWDCDMEVNHCTQCDHDNCWEMGGGGHAKRNRECLF